MSLPLIELAGESSAPLLHLAPANGFPPRTYLPLLRKLSGFRSLCLPPRALWGDQAPPSDYRDWKADADDLLAGFVEHDLRDVVAVGHSLGGVISMLALLKAPKRFKALIMLDPPILLPDKLQVIRAAWTAAALIGCLWFKGRSDDASISPAAKKLSSVLAEASLRRLVRRIALAIHQARCPPALK